MNKLLIPLALVLASLAAKAQPGSGTACGMDSQGHVICPTIISTGVTNPTGSCDYSRLFVNRSTGEIVVCKLGVWEVGGGSGSGVTSVTALPATCTPPKQVYLSTGSTGYYNCTAPDTWSMVAITMREIVIEGMTQGTNAGWSANYYLLGNGVWQDATWPLNDGTHQAPRLIVPAGARLTANNPTVVSGTYTSGGTVQGSAGQTCTWTATQPTGGRSASGTVALGGTNSITGGTALAVADAGLYYLTAPVAATLSKSPTDTATSCADSIVISTVLSYTPAGPYKIISVTTTNPTLNIGLQVASADNVNAGSMGLQYACVPLGSARANPTRTALDPIPLTTIPTNSAIYWGSRQVTCTGTPTAPASLYLYFDPTAPSGGSLVNYKWHIKYPEAQ